MDMETDQIAPTPAIRSAVTIPRPKAPPTAQPRTNATRAAAPPSAAPRRTTPRPDTMAASQAPVSNPVAAHGVRCPLCCRPHELRLSAIFRGMQPTQRQQVAQAHGYCLNCLALWHATEACTSIGLCQLCDRPHHTLLHRPARRNVPVAPPTRHTRNNVPQRPHTHHNTQERRPHWQQDHRPRQWTHPGARYRPPAPATHRHPARQRSRRPTGLSNVVATLQQLQRLLGWQLA
ncbi:uncharacterized protein [Eurosta solidaginis]|uniref:uncharacterized protein n=1 Tax=Eurosta solidaginis TaxID=178769 RepID=UPI003530F92C